MRLKEFLIFLKAKQVEHIAYFMNDNQYTIDETLKELEKLEKWREYGGVLENIIKTYRENGNAKSALNKQLNKYGFYYNSYFKVWVNKNRKRYSQINPVELSNRAISMARYYDAYRNAKIKDIERNANELDTKPSKLKIKEVEKVQISLDKNIYDELIRRSEIIKCENKEEYLKNIILKSLENEAPRNEMKLFSKMLSSEIENSLKEELEELKKIEDYEEEH